MADKPQVAGEPTGMFRRLRAVVDRDHDADDWDDDGFDDADDAGPGDYTQLILRRRNRRMVSFAATVVGLAIFAALFLIPLRSWLRQREQIEIREREVAALEAANEQLAAENARLQTEDGLAGAASDLNLGEPGTQVASVIVQQVTFANLPDGWPTGLVKGIVSARIVAATPPTTVAVPVTTSASAPGSAPTSGGAPPGSTAPQPAGSVPSSVAPTASTAAP